MPLDYAKIGLRVGLEIHQQLDAGHKLFCSCPLVKSESFPVSMTRRLRPVAGELGTYDPAALYEYVRDRAFVYAGNAESSCLVEYDDTPPHAVNEEALHTAIQIGKLLMCRFVGEAHVMRKTVIDGSSVSGFQRTMLIGMDGIVETKSGPVAIQTVCLEEDSAPAVRREGAAVEYRLDRMGVPLIEIATSSDVHSPQHAREVAEQIGLLVRSTNVLRGIGTIRQDVNVSVANGARVEIKGFQELEKIEKVIENEAARQLSLLEIKNELHRRGLQRIDAAERDVTAVFRNAQHAVLRRITGEGGRIHAFVLPQFAGLMATHCGDRTFGKELDSYAKAYGLGTIHSDEAEKQTLTAEFRELRALLRAGERDLIVIVAGPQPGKAVRAVIERARQCLLGVPEETRVSDGIGSKYTRPLPGAERMYPETDIPPIRIDAARIAVPETLFEKEEALAKELPKELAAQLVRSRAYQRYELLKNSAEPLLVATTLLSTMTDLRRKGVAVDALSDDALAALFALVANGKMSKSSLPEALALAAAGSSVPEIAQRFRMLTVGELRALVDKTVSANPGASEGPLIGLVMKAAQGRADPALVQKLVKERHT